MQLLCEFIRKCRGLQELLWLRFVTRWLITKAFPTFITNLSFSSEEVGRDEVQILTEHFPYFLLWQDSPALVRK